MPKLSKFLRSTVVAVFASGLMPSVSAAVTIDDNCLAYGDCTVSGAFAPHPQGSLASLGVWQASANFTLPNVGDLFYGRTGQFTFDTQYHIRDQNGHGTTIDVLAGDTKDIVFGRAPLQNPTFDVDVAAIFGVSAPVLSFSMVISNQPIADAIITQSLRSSGYNVDMTLAQLRTDLGLSGTANSNAIAAALDSNSGTGGGIGGSGGVSPVPVPAAGWLLLVGLGVLGAFKRRLA